MIVTKNIIRQNKLESDEERIKVPKEMGKKVIMLMKNNLLQE
jgi:hypothetical protein